MFDKYIPFFFVVWILMAVLTLCVTACGDGTQFYRKQNCYNVGNDTYCSEDNS